MREHSTGQFIYYKDDDLIWVVNETTGIYYFVSVINQEGLILINAIRRFKDYSFYSFHRNFPKVEQITGLRVLEMVGKNVLNVVKAATKAA